MRIRLRRILVFLTILAIVIVVVPELGNSSCTNSLCVGYWVPACQVYDQRCESCGICDMTCFYLAAVFRCKDQYGNERQFYRCRSWLCGYETT